MATQRPKRKRRHGPDSRRKRGVMMGMRSGFKKATSSVVGGDKARQRKPSWVGTAVSIVLLIAAVAFLLYRWR